MSQENVEIVRRCVDAWSRWDFEAMKSIYADDVEIVSPAAEMFGRTYRGLGGLRDYLQEFTDVFEPIQLDLERIFDGGELGVVCVVRIQAREHRSGIQLSYRNASVFTVRDGLIHREVVYEDPVRALEAVGPSE
jgi:ketosteroid isomerase-like protein